jgi:hypothetical protein
MKKIINILLISGFIISTNLHAKLLMQGGYSHEFTVIEGGVYKKSIKLKNMGKTPLEIKLYLEDYLFDAKGTSSFTAAHLRRNTRSNSQWITFAPNRLIIAPNMEKTVSYTMIVPNTSVIGTYWSTLIVEPVSPYSLESSQKKYNDKKVHLQIQQVSRHAIQIVAQIGETGQVNLSLKNPQMKRQGSQRTFSLDAYNFGSRWIKPTVWMDIHDQKGNFMGKFTSKRGRIYPKTSVRYPIDISSLRKGNYKGLFVLDGGNDSDIMATDVNLAIK